MDLSFQGADNSDYLGCCQISISLTKLAQSDIDASLDAIKAAGLGSESREPLHSLPGEREKFALSRAKKFTLGIYIVKMR